ncbi:MAG: hypothetical protein WCP52_09385 [Bacteroidota bacterium]
MKTQFVTDDNGKKIAVILPLKNYQRMLEELEELEDIRLYDEAKMVNEPSIPIEKAFSQIEAKRKSKK